MTLIQVILIALAVLALIFGNRVFRSKLSYRLVALCLCVLGTSFVLFPNATTSLAHDLGVGRGADLLLYISVFAGIFGFFLLYTKIRVLEGKLTEQVRATALRDAQVLTKPENQTGEQALSNCSVDREFSTFQAS